MLFIFSRFHKDHLLFVLDFTRIDVDDSKSYQDFIVHFYYFENGEEKALPLHFLPIDSGTPNDVDFFSSSLSDIFEEEIVKQHLKYASEIIFWSDGGRHHFKQRKSMLHVLEFQKKIGINIVWNFFPSYHGHGVCDADAAQVKRAIRKDQKENSSIITKPQEIVKIINSVGKHEGRIIDISKSDHDTKSLTGISKFHNFTFNPGSMNVYASLYSTTNSIDKTWHVTVSTRNNE